MWQIKIMVIRLGQLTSEWSRSLLGADAPARALVSFVVKFLRINDSVGASYTA